MAETSLPTAPVFGPDPEPLGIRAEILVRGCEPRSDCEPAPTRCALAAVLGAPKRCLREACVFYRVPGVPATCAVLHWCPDIARRRELSAWFAQRRADVALAAPTGDPLLIAGHTLGTPGPGAE